MHLTRQTMLLASLVLACGGKEETSGTEANTDATTTSASDPSTGETVAPTTSGSSTGVDSSSTGAGSSTGAAESSTGEAPACETSGDDCGVTVSGTGSACADPPPAKDELVLEVLGPGEIKITEKGRTSACNITIGSEVFLAPNKNLIVNYVISGQPDRSCQCPQEVTSTVSGLSAGTWTVLVGSYTEKVDVP